MAKILMISDLQTPTPSSRPPWIYGKKVEGVRPTD